MSVFRSRAARWGIVACFALLPLACVFAAPAVLNVRPSTNDIPRFHKVEFVLELSEEGSKPEELRKAEVELRLLTPAGTNCTVRGFWLQGYEHKILNGSGGRRDWFYPGRAGWRIRFTPLQVGEYTGTASLALEGETFVSSPVRFRCVPSEKPGFVRVSRPDPRFLEFSSGQPFFPVGMNIAFVGHQQYATFARAKKMFESLAANGGNYVRLWGCCEDWALAIEARKSAFGRSWNWDPPIVPMPGAADRKCLALTARRPRVAVDPSHPVGLRKGVRYRFTMKYRAEEGARVIPTINGERLTAASATAGEAWAAFTHEFNADGDWLQETNLRLQEPGEAWLAELSLTEATGGAELLWEADVNRPVVGSYNPLDSFMLDRLVEAAEGSKIYLQLCLLTRDLYMSRLKDPASEAYSRAVADAKQAFRYAVARWGYSPAVGAWEYWNEMDPGLPTEKFYTELGEFLGREDIYGRPRTTSTWGPSARDAAHPKLDIADRHFYLRPADGGKLRDEVDAVLHQARWLREVAPAKPAMLGEFGLADDKWAILDEMKQSRSLADVHNVLWSSALSGLSGSALFWWWERLDERDVYRLYLPLTRFIQEIPWNAGGLRRLSLQCPDPELTGTGLQADERAWLWLFHQSGSWKERLKDSGRPSRVEGAVIRVDGLPEGRCAVRWWDTETGRVLLEQDARVGSGKLELRVPAFSGDIACRLEIDAGEP